MEIFIRRGNTVCRIITLHPDWSFFNKAYNSTSAQTSPHSVSNMYQQRGAWRIGNVIIALGRELIINSTHWQDSFITHPLLWISEEAIFFAWVHTLHVDVPKKGFVNEDWNEKFLMGEGKMNLYSNLMIRDTLCLRYSWGVLCSWYKLMRLNTKLLRVVWARG